MKTLIREPPLYWNAMVDFNQRMAVPKPVAQKLAIAADDAATQAEYDDSVEHKTVRRLRMSANSLRADANDPNKDGEFVSVRAEDVVRATKHSTQEFTKFRTEAISASLSMLSNYEFV